MGGRAANLCVMLPSGLALQTHQPLSGEPSRFSRMRAQLCTGARVIVTMRDGAVVANLLQYVSALGFGQSAAWVMESLGGPRERIRETRAAGTAIESARS